MTIHVFTSFSYSYLDRARVLAQSLQRHHPDWMIWAVITDRPPEGFKFDLKEEPFDRYMDEIDLLGNDAERWLFRHDIVEACTAVKGHALCRLLDEPDCEAVIYLDPDIAVLGSLQPVVDILQDSSVVLTPHQVAPEPTTVGITDNEMGSLAHGAYNLGFIAVSNRFEGRAVARWWADRLDKWCYDRRDIGVFVDQKWCDLIPCYFDGVSILRDPGYNVASWNLACRKVKIADDGTIAVNGFPIRFYHFTKLGPAGDAQTKRYAGNNVEVYEIWSWYRREVSRNMDPRIPKGYWHYGAFEDGSPIPKPLRELYRDRGDLMRAFPNPRSIELKHWYEAEIGLESPKTSPSERVGVD